MYVFLRRQFIYISIVIYGYFILILNHNSIPLGRNKDVDLLQSADGKQHDILGCYLQRSE